MKKIFELMLLLVCCTMMSCVRSASTTYQPATVECLGVEYDGTQTLRVFATGHNKWDAREQGRKEAVHQVIFGGVPDNGKGCDMRPLVNEPNAKEKYEEYFARFFADNGSYKQFTSMDDERFSMKNRSKSKVQVRYGSTVRVNRVQLKARLKADGILK